MTIIIADIIRRKCRDKLKKILETSSITQVKQIFAVLKATYVDVVLCIQSIKKFGTLPEVFANLPMALENLLVVLQKYSGNFGTYLNVKIRYTEFRKTVARNKDLMRNLGIACIKIHVLRQTKHHQSSIFFYNELFI